jgi:LEA14-like dessication related protein
MKKRTLFMAAALAAAALLCGLLYTSCALLRDALAPKMPEVMLESIDFSEIDFRGLTLLSKVNVRNTNTFDIPLPKIDWKLFVIDETNLFAEGSIESDGSIRSNMSTIVEFPVRFTYLDMVNTIVNLNDDNARYKIKLTVHILVPGLGDMSLPFEHEGKIPILRFPEITVAAAPSATFTYGLIPGVPTGATIAFALNIKNSSNIAVTVNDFSYDLRVGTNSLSNGGVLDRPRINPGATERITVQFPLNAADIVRVGAAALTGNFRYNLNIAYSFGIPEFPLLNNVGGELTLQ